MISRPTHEIAANELLKMVTTLENLAIQTVAHRKKFQLAVSQFRHFAEAYSERSDDEPLQIDQIEALRYMSDVVREYQDLFSQNFLHCWAHSALDCTSTSVAADLTALSTRLNEYALVLDQDDAYYFDASSPQWLQYHILDLRAINMSFQQYVKAAKPDDPVVKIMEKRLASIDQFMSKYNTDDIVPGTRIFSPIPIHYQTWRLEHSDFEKIKEAGSGISAVVYYGKDKRNGNEIAIKELKFKKLTGNKLHSFQRELTILATATHPCLLKFVGATDTNPYCIVTEWMPGDSLYHDLHRNHRMDATKLTIAAYDIARGMAFLHSLEIIHRDLKSLNILLDKDGRAKICDFGFSRKTNSKKEEPMTGNVGTPHWMAPELLSGTGSYNNKVDVYAYGILLWELISHKIPYQGLESSQIIGQVLMNDIRPVIPSNVSPELKNLIQTVWSREPEQRPDFDDIVAAFRTGDYIFPNADAKVVKEYMEKNCDQNEITKMDMESLLASSDDQSTINLIKTIEKEGVPINMVDKCWERLMDIKKLEKYDIYSRGLYAFLGTKLKHQASREFREFPTGKLPKEVIVSAVSHIPTGDEKVDDDIIVAACKNGASTEAAIHSFQDDHLKIAFEVISHIGVNEEQRGSLIDRCVKSLKSEDPMLVVAATRCLVSLNEARKIGFDVIKTHIQSRNITMKSVMYLAAAKMVNEGEQIPLDLLDAFLSKGLNEPFAGLVIFNVCRDLESAKYLLGRLTYGSMPPQHLTVRALIQIYNKHESLRADLKNALNQIPFPSPSPEVVKALHILRAKIDL